MNIKVEKSKKLNGVIEIPADKSVTHRAFMFSALAKGRSKISNYSKGADCMSTLKIIQQLGCSVDFVNENELVIDSINALQKPVDKLYCGNSGTTARLMMGILAGQNFDCEMYGDESLSKRPMKRVIGPLHLMGANILHNDFKMPVEIKGCELNGITFNSPLSSAQVKSCVLLAGLNAKGTTTFIEPFLEVKLIVL